MLAIIMALLPEIMKGVAQLIQDYEQGKIDAATLAAQVRDAFNRGGDQAATLAANFSDAHIQAFMARLKADAPAKP